VTSARSAFVLLFVLMVFNYLDRTIVATMFVPLKAEWGVSDRELGFLASVVPLTIAVCAIPLSIVADRWSRLRAIVVMALAWNGATIGAAFATDYASLLAMRALVGVGEAAYGPTCAALLAALFPREQRSTVLGAFFLASVLGALIGMLLGGAIVSPWGWRAGFWAAGLPGMLLAVALLVMRRPQWDVGPTPTPAREKRAAIWVGLGRLLTTRTVLLTCIGGALQLLPAAVIFAWMPAYLEREAAFSPQAAALTSAGIILASGIGIVAWGHLADRRQRHHRCGRLQVSIVGALVAGTLLTVAFALLAPGALQIALIAAGAGAVGSAVGPVNAVVIDSAPPQLGATAAALANTIANLLGFAVGPLLAGVLSDRFGLPVALIATSLLCLPAAGAFALATLTYAHDAAHVDAPPAPPAARRAASR